MTYYLLVDGDRLHGLLSSIMPGHNQNKLEIISDELAKISGQYIRGNLLISLVCSIVTFTGLFLLQIPYALPLAIFAGILDLLPLIGSTIGAVPAVLISLTLSPLKGLLAIALFILYQEFENDILAPNVYKQVLNLIPFLSFIAVIIGSLLFGIAGAFLALPIAAGVPTILNYFKTGTKAKQPTRRARLS
jgi:predicted PurR-regulated permease PerM